MANQDVFVVADQWEPQASGMGVYAYEIARRLPALLARVGLRTCVAVRADAPRLADEVRAAGGEVIELLPSTATGRRKLLEVYGRLPLRARGWNCYYALDHKLPPKALLPRCRIATVHDICPLEFPAEYGTLKRLYFRAQLPAVLRSAHRVVTVSGHTARKLVDVLHADPGRLLVSPNGFDAARFSADAAPDDAQRVFAAYGVLPKSYHLFVGRVSPRKNFALVIEAVRWLKAHGEDPTVVVAGPKGWRDEDDWARIRHHGLDANFRKASYVPSELFPALYRLSRGLLYPSFSEGFGIPVLESLACGAPVVVARGTSCEEIGGPLVDAIDPLDAQALAGWMGADHALDEPARREWLARFSWDRTADGIAAELVPLLAGLRQAGWHATRGGHPSARTP